MRLSPVPWKVEVRLNYGGRYLYYRSDTEFLEIDDALEAWAWDDKDSEPRQICGPRKEYAPFGKAVPTPKQKPNKVQQSLW